MNVIVVGLAVSTLALSGCSGGGSSKTDAGHDAGTDEDGGSDGDEDQVATWIFESEDENNHGCGEVATGCDGAGVDCWHADDDLCPTGGNIAFGPYTEDLPLGTYKVTWRMRADVTGMQPDAQVVGIDVYADPNLYIEKRLTAADFPEADTFYEFDLTFLLQSEHAVEFRTGYLGGAPFPGVWIDKVTVTEADPFDLVFESEDEGNHGCGAASASCDGAGEGCWYSDASLCPGGGTPAFGPYYDQLPYGTYRFTWRMKADMTGLSPDEDYLVVNVAINPTAYAFRKLRPGDFPSADSFYDISLDCLIQVVGPWEFTAIYSNAAAIPDLWIDKITVEPIPPPTEWTFEAEGEMDGHVCGELDADCGASTPCWHGSAAACAGGNAFVYGPYTYQLPRGSFRATYYLKSDTSASAPTDELFWIDVAGPSGPIVDKVLTAGDFPSADEFQTFTLDFDCVEPTPFEFRAGYGVGDRPDIWMDKVVVTPTP